MCTHEMNRPIEGSVAIGLPGDHAVVAGLAPARCTRWTRPDSRD